MPSDWSTEISGSRTTEFRVNGHSLSPLHVVALILGNSFPRSHRIFRHPLTQAVWPSENTVDGKAMRFIVSGRPNSVEQVDCIGRARVPHSAAAGRRPPRRSRRPKLMTSFYSLSLSSSHCVHFLASFFSCRNADQHVNVATVNHRLVGRDMQLVSS